MRREMIKPFYENVFFTLGIDELPNLFKPGSEILDVEGWNLGEEEVFDPVKEAKLNIRILINWAGEPCRKVNCEVGHGIRIGDSGSIEDMLAGLSLEWRDSHATTTTLDPKLLLHHLSLLGRLHRGSSVELAIWGHGEFVDRQTLDHVWPLLEGLVHEGFFVRCVLQGCAVFDSEEDSGDVVSRIELEGSQEARAKVGWGEPVLVVNHR